MKAIRRLDQYLRLRGDTWHYVRRVPKAVRHIDNRTLIYRSLDTDSRKVARQRRDICADEDNQRWNEIMPNRFQPTPKDAIYCDASHRARSKGFNYQPMENLISQNTVTDLLHRLIALEPLKDSPQKKEEQDADALLGSVKTPSATITEAMDLYLSEIVADELSSKSPEQITNFSKIKRRAVANFVKINGDIDMRDIRRELDTAFNQRRTCLIERGYAELRQEETKTSIVYKRGYVKALETEGFNAATEKLESVTGKAHVAAQAGRLIEGTVAQKLELPQGPHAIIETQRAFYLVPWESTHAQKWGKRIKGRVLSGGGIDWDAGRTRGIGR